MNAKKEFLKAIEGKQKIQCAFIELEKDNKITFKNVLSENYTDLDYQSFINSLDFNYDPYEFDVLTGVIWLSNGEWIKREYFHGYGSWRHYKRPEIPDFCLKKQ